MGLKYTPYKYWSRIELELHFLRQIDSFKNAPEWVKPLMLEAVWSSDWFPQMDFDGCTAVQDTYHPCLACFLHDYLWRIGRGGSDADNKFYQVMLLDGTPKAKALVRWAAVRAAWFAFYKWKYSLQRIKK